MNNVFDKGAINKAVAKTPKFTLTMKIRKMVTPDGREIDMFTQQNEMFGAILATAPTHNLLVTLPWLQLIQLLKTKSVKQYLVLKV